MTGLDHPASLTTGAAIPSDIRVTFAELVNIVSLPASDPRLSGGAFAGLFRPFAPRSLLAAYRPLRSAFTVGYQRSNKYGGAVLYGVVLGFVVYVVTELAWRSGYAGVLDPAFATEGPALAAIVIGLTVLLYKEDGRA